MSKKIPADYVDRYKGEAGQFQSLDADDGPGP